MAKKNYRNVRRVKRNNRSSEMRRFAYNMGCVDRGLANPDSQISESYSAGKTAKSRKRKTLY